MSSPRGQTAAAASLGALLFRASRSRRLLWIAGLTILAMGAVAGYIGSRLQPTGPWNLGERIAALGGATIDEPDEDRAPAEPAADDVDNVSMEVASAFAGQVRQPGVSFEHVLYAIPRLAPLLKPAQHEAVRAVLAQRFSPEQTELAIAYIVALGRDDGAAVARLRELTKAEPPPRYARYALGRVEMKQRHYQDAYALFRAEGREQNASEARWMAVQALIKAKDFARLEELRHEEAYRPYFTRYVSLQIAIGARNWREIVRRSPLVQLETFEPRILVMTLVVGLAWVFFFLHLGEAPRMTSLTPWLCVVALGLGVLSTVPTLYAVILQDDILHFSPRGDPLHTVLYFVGGVGLREEICKLALFAPLLPMLLRRGDEFEALIVASFIGLGFAIEENGGYFLMSQMSNAPGRFLTANFLHAALTGLNGLALFRACSRGGAGLNEFCLIVPATIIAHGLYDAGLSLPQIDDTGTIAMAVFIGCAWYYFGRVHELRNNVRMTISLTGAYIIAIAIVAAAMLAFQMMNLGPRAGVRIAATEILGSAIVVFMFLREFREPLSD